MNTQLHIKYASKFGSCCHILPPIRVRFVSCLEVSSYHESSLINNRNTARRWRTPALSLSPARKVARHYFCNPQLRTYNCLVSHRFSPSSKPKQALFPTSAEVAPPHTTNRSQVSPDEHCDMKSTYSRFYTST